MDPKTAAEAGGTIVGSLAVLAKPAKTLIEKVSSALGIAYEPTRVMRSAHAEVEADKIRALGRIEVSDIEQRGLLRMVREQGRIQANIESITEQAGAALNDHAEPEKMEDDWIANFFDRCKLVSKPEMQALWAKVLAGEANKKDSFSKRTVELVSVIEQGDAEIFSTLCGFGWYVNSDIKRVPLVTNYDAAIYKQNGITFSVLTHLDSLGLIRFSPSSQNHATFPSSFTVVAYHGMPFNLTVKTQPLVLRTGQVMFTQAGFQLSRISGQAPVPGLEEYVLNYWRQNGIEASPLVGLVANEEDQLVPAAAQ